MSIALADEVSRFREWAATQSRTSGEWECDYPHWTALYAATTQALDDESWRTQPAAIVYVLARDNECEIIRAELRQRPALLRELAPSIVAADEPDARWQLASTLGELAVDWGAALLAALAGDRDEYVRRRALLAMGETRHPSSEHFARLAWNSGEQYPRMAALHVLHELAVVDIDALLVAAEQSAHEYLRAAAKNVLDARRRAK